jgi:hypothetical protein
MRPADLPFTEHFQQMPCGMRAKYVSGGCRCMLCRAAASRYESERLRARRSGEWNGLVSAAAARKHLLRLSKQGVGRRSVSDAALVPQSTLQEIKTGRKTQIRRSTERRILAVTKEAAGMAFLVPAAPTWALIERLLEEGFTRTRIAREIGRKAPSLQLRTDRITKRNAIAIERLYRRYAS